MRLIALETATDACSAALFADGEVLERYQVAPRGHAALILPMIEDLLREADLTVRELDAVAVGRGPGSFTGVRIAAGVAQGIAFGADLPVVPVSSLAALAQGAMDELGAEHVLVAVDARMDEVYWGLYRRGAAGLAELDGAERVCGAAAVTPPPQADWAGVGSGWGRYGEVLRGVMGTRLTEVLADRYPRAGAVARLAAAGFARGDAVPAEGAAPVYLRNDVVGRP